MHSQHTNTQRELSALATAIRVKYEQKDENNTATTTTKKMQRKGIHDQGTRMRWKRNMKHGHSIRSRETGKKKKRKKTFHLIAIDEEKGSQPANVFDSWFYWRFFFVRALCYKIGWAFPSLSVKQNVDRLCMRTSISIPMHPMVMCSKNVSYYCR